MWRSIVASILAAVWALALPLACLPNSSMTPAEMECCKKMAGNCDMGGGNHKCCDTTINHAAPSAAIVHDSAPQAHVLAAVSDIGMDFPQVDSVEQTAFLFITISPSPPLYSS